MTPQPLPAPRAVLFDLDGTLADSEPLIARLQLEVLAANGHSIAEGDMAPLTGSPFPEKMIALKVPQPHEAMDEQYRERYAAELAATSEIEGAGILLSLLSERGVASAIVSNKVEDGARRLITALGWDKYCAVIVGRDSAADGTRKPRPGPAFHALAKLGLAAVESVFVGDSAADMTCGKQAGCAAVIGLTGTYPEKELRAAGATHICDSLADVKALLVPASSA